MGEAALALARQSFDEGDVVRRVDDAYVRGRARRTRRVDRRKRVVDSTFGAIGLAVLMRRLVQVVRRRRIAGDGTAARSEHPDRQP
jgi:hypothetical protein